MEGLITNREYLKKINLPVTKTLYYKSNSETTEVKNFTLLKEFNISDYWAVLELQLVTGEKKEYTVCISQICRIKNLKHPMNH